MFPQGDKQSETVAPRGHAASYIETQQTKTDILRATD